MKIWLLDKGKNIDSYENRRFNEEATNTGIDYNEVNCAPEYEGFEYAIGINVPMEIYEYVQIRLEGILSKTRVF